MGDPTSRRNQTRNRLRAQLRKKRESLADQFDFKIYIAFVFKEKVSHLMPSFPHCSILSCILASEFFDSVVKVLCFYPLFSEKEVCTFWSCWSAASDDQQLWRKHLTRCAGFQLLSWEFYRAPAKGCCATTRPTVPVNAKGESIITDRTILNLSAWWSNVMIMLQIEYVHWWLLIDDWQKHIYTYKDFA